MGNYNVIWNTPSKDSSGSMPIGNGDIGMNVWVEDGGDLVFYISKTDAWSEKGELLKLGRVRVKLLPNHFKEGLPFQQILKLRQSEIVIHIEEKQFPVELRLWVDANRPIIHVEAKSQQKFDIQANLELWRDNDSVFKYRDDCVAWYHRNETSNFTSRLEAHNLDGLEKSYPDPLLYRTFGGVMLSKNMIVKPEDKKILTSANPANDFDIQIHILTAQTVNEEKWLEQIENNIKESETVELEKARKAHQKWWFDFWNRSWIFVNGDEDASNVTRGYILQVGGQMKVPTI